MNIIDPEVTFNPNTMKLIHCNACDATWAAKKIPAVCPYCGKPKGKNGVGSASEDDCMSWGEEYMELMAKKRTDEPDDGDRDGYDEYADGDAEESVQMDAPSQDTGSTEESFDYSPIGYDPDELANSMNGKKKIGKQIQKQMISDAEKEIKETKWAVQRAGLPTDAFQNVLPDVKSKADSLGGYIPMYVSLLLKMTVDNTIQRELRHPRKGRVYTVSDIDDMLEELDINENYWESYYAVAGLI